MSPVRTQQLLHTHHHNRNHLSLSLSLSHRVPDPEAFLSLTGSSTKAENGPTSPSAAAGSEKARYVRECKCPYNG